MKPKIYFCKKAFLKNKKIKKAVAPSRFGVEVLKSIKDSGKEAQQTSAQSSKCLVFIFVGQFHGGYRHAASGIGKSARRQQRCACSEMEMVIYSYGVSILRSTQ